MNTHLNAAIPATERAQIFHEEYGEKLDGATTLAALVECCGNYLSEIVGPADADAGMHRMLTPLFEAAGEITSDGSSWRERLRDSASYCFSEWPMGQRLHELAAYAVYGIALTDFDDKSEVANHLEQLIEVASAFEAASPMGQWKLEDSNSHASELVQLVQLAKNRWDLDHGRSVEPAALAKLGNVSEGRVRNLMSGSSSTLRNERGRVPASDALKWLHGRPEFWDSIWASDSVIPDSSEKTNLEEPVFVPVSREGTIFHPGLRSGNNYTVGAKGSEAHIETFSEALASLQKMRAPFWRRPNKKGNWGIVRGVRWIRINTSELNWYAENPHARLPQQEDR